MEETTFDLHTGMEILRRTPGAVRAWLAGLPEDWVRKNEGPETWSPFDVVGHLAHGERTDWIPRAEQILAGEGGKPFPPFDRFAQLEESVGKSLGDLLDEFEALRAENLEKLEGFQLTEEDLGRTGTHPEFGTVTLRQLLATWVTHDLTHMAQIARVMASQHREEVGPWKAYLSVLQRRQR
jgi:uncharacterized damage-inducible protein DinB